MTTIVFIHGHGATEKSFELIKHKIVQKPYYWHSVEYNSDEGFEQNLSNMAWELNDDEFFFIAHSMGSIYAAYLANALLDHGVLGGVCISAPWKGSQAAYTMQMLDPASKIYRDVAPNSPVITGLEKFSLEGWTSIVSMDGKSKLIQGANDGVLTYDSMTNGPEGLKYVEVAANHYEVLMSYHTIKIIKEALESLEESV
jgi:pimeloyl-ACP methyl ester carboxylesterase